jgi:hypothetical protein
MSWGQSCHAPDPPIQFPPQKPAHMKTPKFQVLVLSKKIVHVLDSKKNATFPGTRGQTLEIWAFS